MTRRVVLGVAVCLVTAACATPVVDNPAARRQPVIQLRPCPLPRSNDTVLCGTHDVAEDRASQSGVGSA